MKEARKKPRLKWVFQLQLPVDARKALSTEPDPTPATLSPNPKPTQELKKLDIGLRACSAAMICEAKMVQKGWPH